MECVTIQMEELSVKLLLFVLEVKKRVVLLGLSGMHGMHDGKRNSHPQIKGGLQ